jgi:hypothetical protein
LGSWAAVRHNARMLQDSPSKQTPCRRHCRPLECHFQTGSAVELARRASISPTTVVRCERGQGIPRVRIETLERIRNTLEAAGVEFTRGTAPACGSDGGRKGR